MKYLLGKCFIPVAVAIKRAGSYFDEYPRNDFQAAFHRRSRCVLNEYSPILRLVPHKSHWKAKKP